MATATDSHATPILYQQRARDVAAEMNRLARQHPGCAPFGGWRNRAITIVAERQSINPYTLDRQIRGMA